MISGGKCWPANEIVIRYHIRQTEPRQGSCDKTGPALSSWPESQQRSARGPRPALIERPLRPRRRWRTSRSHDAGRRRRLGLTQLASRTALWKALLLSRGVNLGDNAARFCWPGSRGLSEDEGCSDRLKAPPHPVVVTRESSRRAMTAVAN